MKNFQKIFEGVCPSDKINFETGGLDERVQVGVDIGASAIKIVQARKAGAGLSFLKVGYQEIAPNPDSSLSSAPDDRIAAALAEAWTPLGIKTKVVRLVISDPVVYLRHIRVPVMTEKELIKSIKWLAEKNTPFTMENAIVDFQILGEKSRRDDQQMDLVIVAVEKKIIDKYLAILKTARLTAMRIDIPAFAIAKMLIAAYTLPRKEMAAMIDVGAQTMSVVIAKGDSLQFARSVPWGGALMTEALMKGLAKSFVDAETIKKSFSLSPTDNLAAEEHHRVADLLEPVLMEAVNQINRCFAYCERELMIEKIQKVYLCGGTAAFTGLDQYLGQALGIHVERFKALGNSPTQTAMRPGPLSARTVEQFVAVTGVLF